MSTSRFLAGAIVGLVAGLLLAPDKGINTRENLANSANKIKDRFNRLTGRAITRLDDLRDYLEQDIDGLPEDVRSRILTILDESEEMAYSPNPTTNAL
ncbi:MAG TPA: YtxH domain-containing protein [Flavipsychrobacter sp.]|nr:YtxH domain-containing protein [Flavipsychrobacter sp.]